MKDLKPFLNESLEENINEGLFGSAISLAELKTMDSNTFLEGILNMYDYIVDNDDMELFYQDYPLKQQALWKNLYKLYEKKLWSIIDVPQYVGTPNFSNPITNDKPVEDEDFEATHEDNSKLTEFIQQSFPTIGELIKVTPTFRRNLRFFLNNSRNQNLDLKPGMPEYIMLIPDQVKDCSYIITINKTTGFLTKLLGFADKKFLMKAFEQINQA